MHEEAHFTIKASEFEGPLPLLLALIEKRKLHISDISLASIVDDYILYLEEHMQEEKKLLQFLSVLSTLLLIKSRALLPGASLTEEDRSEIYDLKHSLERGRALKVGTKNIIARMRGKGFIRAINNKKKPENSTSFSSYYELKAETLTRAAEGVVLRIPRLDERYRIHEHLSIKKKIRLEEVISLLMKRVQNSSILTFSKLTEHSKDSYTKVLHFLALLELVRCEKISAQQTETHGDILIESSHVALPRYGA